MGAIQFHNVTRRFADGTVALRNVSVTLAAGSMTFLCGHSGAGKSTFLRLLMRRDRATSGTVVVNGVDIGKLTGVRLPRYRQRLGVVFQDPHLLSQRSVFENVALPLRVAGVKERTVEARVRAALSRVELTGKEHMLPRQLSAGERQRAGIARAVVHRPKVLLADEPTGNLDPVLSQSMMGLFRQFRDIGTTVVVASHDVDLVAIMGGRVIELAHGVLTDDRGPEN